MGYLKNETDYCDVFLFKFIQFLMDSLDKQLSSCFNQMNIPRHKRTLNEQQARHAVYYLNPACQLQDWYII